MAHPGSFGEDDELLDPNGENEDEKGLMSSQVPVRLNKVKLAAQDRFFYESFVYEPFAALLEIVCNPLHTRGSTVPSCLDFTPFDTFWRFTPLIYMWVTLFMGLCPSYLRLVL